MSEKPPRNPNPKPYPGTREAKASGCTCKEISVGDCMACKVHEMVGIEAETLIDAAADMIVETILRARDDPNGYPCWYWQRETVKNQIGHIRDHANQLILEAIQPSLATGEPHLAHIITRAAIAAALEAKGKR